MDWNNETFLKIVDGTLKEDVMKITKDLVSEMLRISTKDSKIVL